MSQKKKIYVVDVSSMFFRAYYAVRALSNSKGLPTNAIYGYLSMVTKLIKDKEPEYLAFCYDRPEPSFRKDLYEEYKANRSEMPEDLSLQMPYIRKVAEVLGVPTFEKKGFEADDLIGTLCAFAEKNNWQSIIVSGDKDFAQLVSPNTTMFDTMKNKVFNEKAVVEKWGVEPSQFKDYLALTGDSSDNIPGVRGVGPKGAQKLIAEYGSLENIYKNLDKITNASLKKKLEESQENAKLSYELVTIKQDVDVELSEEALTLGQKDKPALEALLDELEFEKLKKTLLEETSKEVKSEKKKPNSNKSEDKESSGTEKVDFKPLEYTKRNFKTWLKRQKDIWLLTSEEQTYFADDKHIIRFNGEKQELKDLLLETSLGLKGFDVKGQCRLLELSLEDSDLEVAWDTQLAAYVLEAGSVKTVGAVAKKYLERTPNEEDLQALLKAEVELRPLLEERLAEGELTGILDDLELPLVPILLSMERRGIALDVDFLKGESTELEKDVGSLEKEIHDLAGEEFNIASPKQLSHILFEKMGLPTGKKTKTGYSTDTSVLEKLGEHEIAQKILQYRELAKLKSTYVDSLPKLVDSETQRVHTQFTQALTTTGRLSSLNPNLQNIPIRTERGARVRKAFVAAPGHVLVSADYSQIELRVLAEISEDPALNAAFVNNEDIHARTASEVFDCSLEDVTYDLRRKAKAVNFGIAYGQGVFGLAESLQISRGEAKEIIANYFSKFPGVKNYMEQVVQMAKDKGYVETLLGRRRYLPDIHAKQPALRAFNERAAINAPIQGTASDIVKQAMIDLNQHYSGKMLLQVHDEMIFELPEKEPIEEHLQQIKSIMETCVEMRVPLLVDASYGTNWHEL